MKRQRIVIFFTGRERERNRENVERLTNIYIYGVGCLVFRGVGWEGGGGGRIQDGATLCFVLPVVFSLVSRLFPLVRRAPRTLWRKSASKGTYLRTSPVLLCGAFASARARDNIYLFKRERERRVVKG